MRSLQKILPKTFSQNIPVKTFRTGNLIEIISYRTFRSENSFENIPAKIFPYRKFHLNEFNQIMPFKAFDARFIAILSIVIG